MRGSNKAFCLAPHTLAVKNKAVMQQKINDLLKQRESMEKDLSKLKSELLINHLQPSQIFVKN